MSTGWDVAWQEMLKAIKSGPFTYNSHINEMWALQEEFENPNTPPNRREEIARELSELYDIHTEHIEYADNLEQSAKSGDADDLWTHVYMSLPTVDGQKTMDPDFFINKEGTGLKKQLDSWDKEGNPIKIDNPILTEEWGPGSKIFDDSYEMKTSRFLSDHNRGFNKASEIQAKKQQADAKFWEQKRQGFVDAAKALSARGEKMAGEGFKYDLLGDK